MAEQYIKGIVPSTVAHARIRVALSRDELVKKVNPHLKRLDHQLISPRDVDAWENGKRGMTWSETYAFTKVTMFPFGALFHEELPPEPLTDFRSPPGGQPRELDYKAHQHLQQFSDFYELAKELCGRVGMAESINVPVGQDRQTHQIAAAVRRTLGVDEAVQSGWESDVAAATEWQRRIEKIGVFVISLPLDMEKLRGASRWDPGGPPAVLISTSDLPSARSFTLLHELAHLTHRNSENAMCDPLASESPVERRMNQVAAEALVPAEWIRRETANAPRTIPFKSWPSSERVRLHNIFNVSNQMLGIRLTELGITPSSGYANEGWAKGNRGFGGGTGRRMTKAQRFQRYLGQPLVQMLRKALDRGSVGEGEVLKHWIKGVKVHDLWKVAGYEQT